MRQNNLSLSKNFSSFHSANSFNLDNNGSRAGSSLYQVQYAELSTGLRLNIDENAINFLWNSDKPKDDATAYLVNPFI